MPVKLRSIGCTIAPLHDIRAPVFEFTDEEFEAGGLQGEVRCSDV